MLRCVKRIKCHVVKDVSEDRQVNDTNDGSVKVYAFRETPDVELGKPVVFAGYWWIVQHFEGDYVYLALDEIVRAVPFGETTSYSESTIRKFCQELERSMGSFIRYCAAGNEYHDRVFIPSMEQYESTWDWPSSNKDNRLVGSNIGQTVYAPYWTSTPDGSGYVWRVSSAGGFRGSDPAYSYGFRPAVKVRYK